MHNHAYWNCFQHCFKSVLFWPELLKFWIIDCQAFRLTSLAFTRPASFLEMLKIEWINELWIFVSVFYFCSDLIMRRTIQNSFYHITSWNGISVGLRFVLNITVLPTDALRGPSGNKPAPSLKPARDSLLLVMQFNKNIPQLLFA